MFTVEADTVDKILRKVFTQLLSNSPLNVVVESKKGRSTEVFGAIIELSNPLARFSRSLARSKTSSALGELCWYLSGSDSLEFIRYYMGSKYDEFSDDGSTINGAYGKRLFTDIVGYRIKGEFFEGNQWTRVIETLRRRNGTRNAVIQIFANDDAQRESKDIPCTCTMQFAIRENKLILHVHMRSNDAVIGLPHDLFSFTMLQEIAARQLGVELGRYIHSIGSLHLYEDNKFLPSTTIAKRYLEEHLLDDNPMAPMPNGDQWNHIAGFLKAEEAIRLGQSLPENVTLLPPYWQELIRLLQIHSDTKQPDAACLIRDHIEHLSPAFKIFALDRLERLLGDGQTARQFIMDGH